METIRPMNRNDLERCAKLLVESYSEDPYYENFVAGGGLQYLESKFEYCKEHSFLLEKNGVIAAFIIGSLSHWSNGPQAIVEEIVTAKNFRRRGYAKMLYDYLEKHFAKRCVKSVVLNVRRDSAAHVYHRNNNFVEVKDCVFMYKPLET